MKLKDACYLEKNAMTNLDSILKNRDITLPTKICIVKAMFFPAVMCGSENWTIKKSECQRTDAFELRSWKRLLRIPWTEKRLNQSVLKEIKQAILRKIIFQYSLEGLRLKLNLQNFGQLMQRANSLENTLILGMIEGKRRRR